MQDWDADFVLPCRRQAIRENDLVPLRVLNVVRFPVGGIRGYLRYTYSRLDSDAYTTTVVAVDDREAYLLPTGMAPISVELSIVPKKRVLLGLTLAVNSAIRKGSPALI